jgi:hypothetical protein
VCTLSRRLIQQTIMTRYLFLAMLMFGFAACQTNKREQEENDEGMSEEEMERAEPTEGNENKPEPVAANYLMAAQCDSITETITYVKHIKPIVNTRCAIDACHDATTKAFDIDMTGYENTRNVFEHGKGLCSVTHDYEARCKHMPTVRIKLPDRHVAEILCWAKTGYSE